MATKVDDKRRRRVERRLDEIAKAVGKILTNSLAAYELISDDLDAGRPVPLPSGTRELIETARKALDVLDRLDA